MAIAATIGLATGTPGAFARQASPGATSPEPTSPETLVPDAPGQPDPALIGLSPADGLVQRLETTPLPVGQPVSGVTPRQDRGGYIAKVLERTPVFDAPGGTRMIWTAQTTSMHTGNATRLMIIKARFDATGKAWLGVQLPVRPNGLIGWVAADTVRIEFTDVFVRVRLRARTVSVYRHGELWSRTRSVIGAARTPTPRGTFAVYETASQGSNPNAYLGPWALHLTSFSNVLKNYGGGPGRVAIHGRGPESIEEAKLGTAKSHGCVRTPNTFVSWLREHALPGTPVQITEY